LLASAALHRRQSATTNSSPTNHVILLLYTICIDGSIQALGLHVAHPANRTRLWRMMMYSGIAYVIYCWTHAKFHPIMLKPKTKDHRLQEIENTRRLAAGTFCRVKSATTVYSKTGTRRLNHSGIALVHYT
jgi:hypothetical protein